MLFGTVFSAGPGRAQTDASGGLEPSFNNVHAFARGYGLTVHPLTTWTETGLINLLRKGPVAMLGALPSLHAVVIGGIRSDATAAGTELTIYDPWPPNIGRVYKVNYLVLMTKFPLATMYMLQR